MYEVDFLAVEDTGEIGSKSGDAIAIRFTESATWTQRVVVIDGGYTSTGLNLANHVRNFYGTDVIDLVISTHPDQDHLNGLITLLAEMTVRELVIHQPRQHFASVAGFSNLAAIDDLIELARRRGVTVTEPFTGLTRFGGQLRILGPTQDYYVQCMASHLAEVASGKAAARTQPSVTGSLFHKAADLLERAITALPFETLGEDGETSPRNNSSVVTFLESDGERMLFTGDAGLPALNNAWDEYLRQYGEMPIDFFQAPHHGSRRNLSPSLLNRIFGEPGASAWAPTSFVSSAKNDPKHPSPKVTNALKRRGCSVYATESNTLWHHDGAPGRTGYGPAAEVGPLSEDD